MISSILAMFIGWGITFLLAAPFLPFLIGLAAFLGILPFIVVGGYMIWNLFSGGGYESIAAALAAISPLV